VKSGIPPIAQATERDQGSGIRDTNWGLEGGRSAAALFCRAARGPSVWSGRHPDEQLAGIQQLKTAALDVLL
jgi:hypothetical protein